MLKLQKGKYFGIQNQATYLSNLVITDTEYTHDKVDWHYHQNPYFTFILDGNIAEISKKNSHECNPGTLLFHHSQDAHYNVKHPGYAHGFHIEAEEGFFKEYNLSINHIEGSLKLDNPVLRSLFRLMYVETKLNDPIKELAIKASLFKVFGILTGDREHSSVSAPLWVKKIREALHDTEATNLSWEGLSAIANVHPVHLSRDFPKYFHTNVGDYIRRIRIDKAVGLLHENKLSVTNISYQCGFADQSHFIRCFKSATGVTPTAYKKIIA